MRYPNEFEAAVFPENEELFLKHRLRYAELSETLVCAKSTPGFQPEIQMYYPEFRTNTRGCVPEEISRFVKEAAACLEQHQIRRAVLYLQSGLESGVQHLIESAVRAGFTMLSLDELVIQALPENPLDRMSPGRAALIKSGDLFLQGLLAEKLTIADLRILTWLLGLAGENLNLQYQNGNPVPFAPKFKRVLDSMGDQYQALLTGPEETAEVMFSPSGLQQAEQRLPHFPETRERVIRVSRLISGYETTDGLKMIVRALRGLPQELSLNETRLNGLRMRTEQFRQDATAKSADEGFCADCEKDGNWKFERGCP